MVKREIKGTESKYYKNRMESFAKDLASQLNSIADQEFEKIDFSEILSKNFNFEDAFKKAQGLPNRQSILKYAQKIVKEYDKAFNSAAKGMRGPFRGNPFENVQHSSTKTLRVAKKYNVSDKGTSYRNPNGSWTSQMKKLVDLDQYLQSLNKSIPNLDDKLFSKQRINFEGYDIFKAYNSVIHIQEALKGISSLSSMENIELPASIQQLQNTLHLPQEHLLI